MEPPRPLSRSRRRPARDLARRLGLRTALTGLLLAGLPVASAHAAGGAAVVIAGPGGTTFAMSEEALRAGTEGGTYTVRAHPGETGEAFTRTGVSVRQLIVLAGIDPEAIGYVVVPRPDGTGAYLPGADFATASPFEAGLPALVSADSGCIRFLRPLTADPDDVNGEDNLSSCGAPLTIGVRDGNVLSVRARASSTATKAGTPIRFSASAEGAKEGEEVTYAWDFGDGADAAGQTASHAFTAPGSYRVTVAATGSEESGGESSPLTIVVGKPVASGTGAGTPVSKKLKRGATLEEAKANGASAAPAKPGTGTAASETAVPEGDDTEPGPDSGAGTLGPVGAPQVHRKGPDGAAPPRAGDVTGAESGTKAEGTETPASGRTVRGELIADFVLPGAGSSSGGGSAAGADSGSAAAAPDGGPVSVPSTGLIAAALLFGGGAIQWRRQSRGALR